jgi:hypothetical protein
VLLCAASQVQAFKISTHLWLADNLLDEICAGVVRIDGREIPLEPQVRESIVRHPDAFLIGVLGADLYPDLIAGQMTTHPGLPPRLTVDPERVPTNVASMAAAFDRPITGTVRGWQTDDWLAFVRGRAFESSGGKATAEVAFAFGYMLHAAMDTWAHSYVNLFTGDLFSIADNQEVAARHTALEVFIEQVHEPYVQPLAKSGPAGCVPAKRSMGARAAQSVDNLSRHAAPTRFVRDTLILHPAAANQYARTPGAQHVFAMWLVWDLAQRSRSDWHSARGALDALVDQAETAVFQADAAWQAADHAKNLAETAAQQALVAKQQAEQFAAGKADALAGVIGDMLDVLENNPAVQATEATIESFVNLLPPPLRTTYYRARNAARDADKALDAAVDAYETASSASSEQAAAALAAFEALELKQAARQAATQARDVGWQVVDTGLDGWRRNIESAVDAYVVAFEETAREIMRGSGNRFRSGANPMEPLKSWAACWGPMFGMPAMPLPPGVAASGCQAGLAAYSQARENLTLLKNNAAFDLLGLSHLKQPVVQFEDHLHERVADGIPAAGQLLHEALGSEASVAAGSASFMAALWDKHVHPDDLNDEFAHDASSGNLPVYAQHGNGPGTITAMLTRDGLPTKYGSSLTAMTAFPPVANALTLSRLTLLDGKGLKTLVESYGVTDSAYPDGDPAYPQHARPGDVLMGAIRSIDGNHQWQPVAPPLPRQVPGAGGNLADGECRRFGYPALGSYGPQPCEKDDAAAADSALSGWLAGKDGFRLWLDPGLRGAVFDRIFVGPLSVAVCERLGSGSPQFKPLGCDSGDPFPGSGESSALATALAGSGKGGAVAAPSGRFERTAPVLDSRGPATSAPARRDARRLSETAREPAVRTPATKADSPSAPSRQEAAPTLKRAPVKTAPREEATRTRDPRRQ